MGKLCFVIMGFGKKTDPSTNKTLDLNQTYKNIIKPAVTAAGYICVRADEIQGTGLIDTSMYALLMQAELVIADISTYNPNAIYELGIRHAVKPFSTIVIKESESKIPFDLNHTRTFTYKHLGEDIGADEAQRCQQALQELIKKVSQQPQVDSPLYEFLGEIEPPRLPETLYQSIIAQLAETEEHLFAITERAANLMKTDMAEAAKYWKKAHEKMPSETYFIQQQALCTYKSKQPSAEMALSDALLIINTLDPDGNVNDPETLGITGAIYKNIYLLKGDPAALDRALLYYGKGFEIRQDYYNGENYALCQNYKANISTDPEESVYFKVGARKTREAIYKMLFELVSSGEVNQVPDKMWIYATLANCCYAVGETSKGKEYEIIFLSLTDAQWQETSYRDNLKQLLKVIGHGS